ncbi:MAG: VWA domain-containing protein [Chromatiales bacterium]|nr:VWA domain-containing protein [Chromatiales bacterium]
MIVPDDFHFLRPAWLLALLPLGWLIVNRWRVMRLSGDWSRVVESHLLGHILLGGTRGRASGGLSIALLAIVWLLGVLAAAGPTWTRLPAPALRLDEARVIVLDLSPSMRAGDLAPDRLIRARYKLLDLLERTAEGQVALVVFSGDAHVAVPLTDDVETIRAIVPVLEPGIMPLGGSELDAGLKLAATLLERSGGPGRVVVITDGVANGAAAQEQIEALAANGHRVAILGVGTEAGAPIPDGGGGFLKDAAGAVVVPGLDSAGLASLAGIGGGPYLPISADDSDVRRLAQWLAPDARRAEWRAVAERQIDRWDDAGAWLVLVLLPFALARFRRGLLPAIAIMVLCAGPRESLAFDWVDWFSRADQRAAAALLEGDPAAPEVFRDPDWRAAANYRGENFDEALKGFRREGEPSADRHYNAGNTLAHLGRYREALGAYDEALKLNPDMQDALHNRLIVDELLRQQQPDQNDPQGQPDEAGTGSGDQGKPQQPSDQQGQQGQASGADAQRGTDTDRSKGQDASSAGAAQEQPPGQPQSGQDESQPAAAQSSADGDPAHGAQQSAGTDPSNEPPTGGSRSADRGDASGGEPLYRSLPDDPGGLLREKFRRQTVRRRQLEAHGLETRELQPW